MRSYFSFLTPHFCAFLFCTLLSTACVRVELDETVAFSQACEVELIVLGVAQDAGIPQIGQVSDPAWHDQSQAQMATSLALVDHRSGARFLFEATPDIRRQLQNLDEMAPPSVPNPTAGTDTLGLSGIFLTHAHIGHYAGLMFLGRESVGASGVPVYAMPRMKAFLETNGPWAQLVSLENIKLEALQSRQSLSFSGGIQITPYRVPHRDEYSETVGYHIKTENSSVLFLPDIDNWDEWEREFGESIETWVRLVDYAFIDATFFDNHELPGRDMSKIPHPRIIETMGRFSADPEDIRQHIQFIHINHTNPIRNIESEKSRLVESKGFHIAREGDRHCL